MKKVTASKIQVSVATIWSWNTLRKLWLAQYYPRNITSEPRKSFLAYNLQDDRCFPPKAYFFENETLVDTNHFTGSSNNTKHITQLSKASSCFLEKMSGTNLLQIWRHSQITSSHARLFRETGLTLYIYSANIEFLRLNICNVISFD